MMSSLTVATASLWALSGCAGGATTLPAQSASDLKVPAWAQAQTLSELKVPAWAQAEALAELKVPAWAQAEALAELKVPAWARTDALSELKVPAWARTEPGLGLKVPAWARTEAPARDPSKVTVLPGSFTSPDAPPSSLSGSALAWIDWP
jgi:hypothetical protein